MMRILIPLSQYLHGSHPQLHTILATYSVGGLLALAVFALSSDSIPLVVRVVISLFALDWGGGVVSNLTSSTIQFYREKSVHIRLLFILIHIIEAGLLYGVFTQFIAPEYSEVLWFLLGLLGIKLGVFTWFQMVKSV